MRKILIIDIETTGFSKSKDVIVEVGIVSLDLENGDIDIIYDKVVKDDRFNIDYHVIRDNHGWVFDNSDLCVQEVQEATPLEDEIPIIQDIINEYSNGATAYNNMFDFGFLEANGIYTPKMLDCPMKLSKDIVCALNKKGDVKNPSMQEAYDFYFPDNEYVEKHRGADDAVHEAEIVYELYKIGIFNIK